MGNSPQMIFQHYREMVRPAAAEDYFAIMPPADAVKRAEVARKPRPRMMPPRDIKSLWRRWRRSSTAEGGH